MTTFAMLVFPDLTQLDLTGPFEVFARCPGARVELVGKSLAPVLSEQGLVLSPTIGLDEISTPDVVFIPGGRGVDRLLTDDRILSWLRGVSHTARFTTSVCTGALVLGAAGLLRGVRATTHWTAMSMLPLLGAVPVNSRTVVDGRFVTGAGVTAGIDFALHVVAEMFGPDVARTIQLSIEYNPEPPFAAGHPDTAPAEVTSALLRHIEGRQRARLEQVTSAAIRLQRKQVAPGAASRPELDVHHAVRGA